MIASLAFTGMILVMSAGLFGAYALGFYDSVKEGWADTRPPSVTPHVVSNIRM